MNITHLGDKVRNSRLTFLSIGLSLFSFSCSEESNPGRFCEILGVAEAYEDTLTIEVVTRELQTHNLSMDASCRNAAAESKEIGFNRLLTGEDLTPKASETMSSYMDYKNAILDSIRKLIGINA